jgi:catechol 2,3-dioxygenase-like lactoylglutathione lyase family enzyme
VRHASSGPQRLPDWNPAAGGIEAFYFRDPDGHFLELIRFPEGKGDPRWQERSGRLFLGIDHTAIAVRDTEASLAFYRDLLGLRVAGESENHGPEQERLNAVFGARLRITGLAAARGPGVELLEYLAPGAGRARPADARASDLLHWQTDLVVRDATAAERALFAAGTELDSPGAVALQGLGRALVAADPDGHRVRLIQPIGGK